MQQSSATPKEQDVGIRKIVACSQSSSQCLLVSTVFGMVSSLHPTSFSMIFILVYMCTCIYAEDNIFMVVHMYIFMYMYDDTVHVAPE